MKLVTRIVAALLFGLVLLVGGASAASADLVSPCREGEIGVYGEVGPVPYSACVQH